MKKILSLLTLALLGAATPVFAAFNYGEDWVVDAQNYTNAHGEGGATGQYYTVNFSGNGKLYLVDKVTNAWVSGPPTAALDYSGYGITRYGYKLVGDPTDTDIHWFTIDGKPGNNGVEAGVIGSIPVSGTINQIIEQDEDGNVIKKYDRKTYYLGTFKKDDVVEIWLAKGTEEVGTATPVEYLNNNTISYKYVGRYDQLYDAFLPTMHLANLTLGGVQIDFGIVANGVESSGGAAGAPLPGGVTIVLVAGLFGLGFWYIRRRKAVAV